MNWYWWGAGKIAKEFIESLSEEQRKSFAGFIDNDPYKWGGTRHVGYPVFSPFSLKNIDDKDCRIVIPISFMGRAIYDIEDTITDIMKLSRRVIRYYYPSYPIKSFEDIEDCMPYKNSICFIGYFVRNDCNMKCRACVACSPLVGKNSQVVPISVFEKDIVRLKSLFPYIHRFSLQGGEVTLDEDLMCDYIKVFRKYYPYSLLDVLTNGTRIRVLKDSTIACFRDNKVELRISLYPFLRDEIDGIISEYRKNGIEIRIDGIIKTFGNRVSQKRIYEKKRRSDACKVLLGTDCWSLSNGKISRCQFPRSIKILNDYFDLELPYDGEIDIYDNDSFEIVRRLSEPIGFCEYCRMNETVFEDKYSLIKEDKVLLNDWLGE